VPTGVYERDARAEPAPASFDALAAQTRAVAEARRARREGFVGGRAALRDALRQLAGVAAALADSDAL
jgi:hypothetical protein